MLSKEWFAVYIQSANNLTTFCNSIKRHNVMNNWLLLQPLWHALVSSSTCSYLFWIYYQYRVFIHISPMQVQRDASSHTLFSVELVCEWKHNETHCTKHFSLKYFFHHSGKDKMLEGCTCLTQSCKRWLLLDFGVCWKYI